MVNFCLDAAAFAKSKGASLAIDSWGVDHAFVDADNRVVYGPVMYRDSSHLNMSEALEVHRKHLYGLTGIAHQPFNTLYQLAARKQENPDLPMTSDWFLLPDLLGLLLTGNRNHERTQASTTQLMGIDGSWSDDAFRVIDWPVPSLQPQPSGGVTGSVNGVPLVSVASHDTGSAVVGVGSLNKGDAYLNVGTWALLGVVIDTPQTSELAYLGNWTNEWGHDGRIRFLKNIPGFYVINRLHSELSPKTTVGDWLSNRDKSFKGRFNPHDPALYNPPRMAEAARAVCSVDPVTDSQFAQAALASLIEQIVEDLASLEACTSPINRLRVVGGGSRSIAFCQTLADTSGLIVDAGPDEATVLGNLCLQFFATGHISAEEVPLVVDRSVKRSVYTPAGVTCASD